MWKLSGLRRFSYVARGVSLAALGPSGAGLLLCSATRAFAPDPSSALLVGLGGFGITLVVLYLHAATRFLRDLTNRDAGSRELVGLTVGFFFCAVTSVVALFALAAHSAPLTGVQQFLFG